MKQAFSLILITILSFQHFYPLAIYAGYYTNQSYYAEILCENKAKPQLQCKGKCALNKQLDQAEKNSQQETSTIKTTETIVYLPVAAINTTLKGFSFQTNYPPFPHSQYNFIFHHSCFHPPTV